MRLGEALAICCKNLDIRNCQYNIAETTRQGRFGPPKSGKRLIDLDTPLVDKLEARIRKLRQREIKGWYRDPYDCTLIAPHGDGSIHDGGYYEVLILY